MFVCVLPPSPVPRPLIPGGQFNLALLLEFGAPGVAVDLEEAAWLYEKAAVQGHAKAQFSLGVLCYLGQAPVNQNDKEALRCHTHI